jgi:hypothetical protein
LLKVNSKKGCVCAPFSLLTIDFLTSTWRHPSLKPSLRAEGQACVKARSNPKFVLPSRSGRLGVYPAEKRGYKPATRLEWSSPPTAHSNAWLWAFRCNPLPKHLSLRNYSSKNTLVGVENFLDINKFMSGYNRLYFCVYQPYGKEKNTESETIDKEGSSGNYCIRGAPS